MCLAAIKNKIVDSISVGGVYHILESASIKPWKIRYYLHSKEKYEDYETYSAKIKAINFLYSNAAELLNQNVLIYSSDEMTGIQALERESPENSHFLVCAQKRSLTTSGTEPRHS